MVLGKRKRTDEEEGGGSACSVPEASQGPAKRRKRDPAEAAVAVAAGDSSLEASEKVIASLDAGDVYDEAQRVLEEKGAIVGREVERRTIAEFWKAHVDGSVAGSMYISGAPGCGKTASVLELKKERGREYKKRAKRERPRVLYINCMKLHNPQKAIFKAIADKLKLDVPSQSAAEEALRTYFSAGRQGPMTVLIADEIDALKAPDVLYALFALPSLSGSSLVLIGIANALVLTEEVLPRLKHSTAKPQPLYFAPYERKQLKEIVRQRLAVTRCGDLRACVEEDALEFCAGKVASQTSDVRAALQMIKNAVGFVEAQYFAQCDKEGSGMPLKKVTTLHISMASRAKSPVVRVIRALPVQQKLLLCSLGVLTVERKGKKQAISLEDVVRGYSALPFAKAGLRQADASALLGQLREQSLVTRKGMQLDVDVRDLANALALDDHLPPALQQLLQE